MKRQELIDFLLAAEKQHVNDLIDILTDFGKGRVALNSTVKNVLISAKESSRPFRRKDVDLLLFEFQKYGGNTIVNVMRSKDGLVSYREILDDVFKLLIGGEDQFTDEQKERKIVEKLFSGEWKCMSFSERYEKSIDIVNIIKKNVIGGGVGNGFINFRLKILTRTNPVRVLTNFVLDGSREASRITIPFVAQIAWLKMTKEDRRNKYEIKPVKISSSQDLIVADTDNKDVILSLTEYAEPPEIKNEFNSSNISVFNQLFGNVPALANKLAMKSSHIVSINIDPEKLVRAKDGNGLRGIVLGCNENGHFGIRENVRIFGPKTLKQVVNSGVIFSLASTVVAQKHLADINEKLKEIQKSIYCIEKFLDNERRSKIDATIELIGEVSQHITKHGQENFDFNEFKGRLMPRLDQNLDIKQHLEKDLEDVCNQIHNIKFDSVMGINNDDDVSNLISQMKKWRENYESYQLCCKVVMMIYAIIYNYTPGEVNKEFYINGLKKIIDKTNEFIDGKVVQIKNHLQCVHKNAKGVTNFESSELAYEALFDRCLEDLDFHQKELSRQLTQVAALVTAPLPFKATLLIENGKIQAGQFLLD